MPFSGKSVVVVSPGLSKGKSAPIPQERGIDGERRIHFWQRTAHPRGQACGQQMSIGAGLLGVQIEANTPMLNERCSVQVCVEEIQCEHGIDIIGAHPRAIGGKRGERKTWRLADALQNGRLHRHRHSKRHIKVIFEEEEIVDIGRMEFC